MGMSIQNITETCSCGAKLIYQAIGAYADEDMHDRQTAFHTAHYKCRASLPTDTIGG